MLRALPLSLLVLGLGLGSTSGCKSRDKYDTHMRVVEEFRSPPDEPRFNQPEEKGYKPPPRKEEFKPSVGAGPGGMGGGGMGGMGR